MRAVIILTLSLLLTHNIFSQELGDSLEKLQAQGLTLSLSSTILDEFFGASGQDYVLDNQPETYIQEALFFYKDKLVGMRYIFSPTITFDLVMTKVKYSYGDPQKTNSYPVLYEGIKGNQVDYFWKTKEIFLVVTNITMEDGEIVTMLSKYSVPDVDAIQDKKLKSLDNY